jgi:hypothetical protein
VELWYVGCCREKEEGKTKLEESRAYLALGWKAGIAGVQEANQLDPIRFTGKTAQSLQGTLV